jgi:outer membrane protein assembly factor BamC
MTQSSQLVRIVGFSMMALVLVSCTTDMQRTIDYKTTRTLPPLEVPPDLASPPTGADPAAKVQPSTTYSQYSAELKKEKTEPVTPGAVAVLPQFSNVQLKREDGVRWLTIRSEPEALWPRVRDFVLANGLLISRENPRIGIIETEWAENRANVGDSLQRTFARWFGTLYSTGLRDRFRFRLERGVEPGTTDVYIVHQGMEEFVLPGTPDLVQTRWRPRASDPELEIEMLRLLMVGLGTPEPAAKQQVATIAATPARSERARLTRDQEAVQLSLQDDLDRAWRRVGLAVDRMGFTVEDRDRSKGVYYVRYLDPDYGTDKGNWFTDMFSSDKPRPNDQFQIHLKDGEQGTTVEVLNKQGTLENSKVRERILTLLYEQLK